MGANIAEGIAKEEFSEAVIGERTNVDGWQGESASGNAMGTSLPPLERLLQHREQQPLLSMLCDHPSVLTRVIAPRYHTSRLQQP